MTGPAVSVVASAYNDERFVERSVASLLEQEGVDLEVIVVDDGSRDATPRILERMASRDARLRVLRQENAGLTRALIRGCAEARAPFIARHDTDDVSLPGRLKSQAEALADHPDWSMVSCPTLTIGPEGELLWEVWPRGDAAANTHRLLHEREGPPAHGAVMFRRDAYEKVGGYRPEFYFTQDVDLWLRLAEVGLFGYSEGMCYAHRVTESSISARHRHRQVVLGDLAHECLRARRAGGDEAVPLAAAAAIRPGMGGGGRESGDGAYFIGRCLLKRRDPRARKYFVNALRKSPWNVKALASLAASFASRGMGRA